MRIAQTGSGYRSNEMEKQEWHSDSSSLKASILPLALALV